VDTLAIILDEDPPTCERCSVVWVGKADSKQEGEVGLEALAFVRTVLDLGLGAYREFAFDCRFVIDQEMNGTCILVFRYPYWEFRISYGRDLSRQLLVIGCGL
jgi:hypothetical protein